LKETENKTFSGKENIRSNNQDLSEDELISMMN